MHRRLACTVALALLVGPTALATDAGAQKKPSRLQILVTNDDGFAAPGIDALVQALRDVRGVKVTVIAPAENKSGTGSSTTPGQLVATDATTASGYPATSVAGFPADTVIYAIEQGGMKKKPDLVMSGINLGQNVGVAVDLSGTVGAAKAAATRGIPAVALSQGIAAGGEPDYAAGAKEGVKWLKQHRKALAPKKGKEVTVVLDNVNIPTCTTGEIRGTVEVPVAGSDVPGIVDPQNCASTLEDPPNDVVGLLNGFITITELPIPTT